MKSIKIISLMAAAMIIAACSTSEFTDIVSNSNDNNSVTVASITRSTSSSENTQQTTEPMTEEFLLVNTTQQAKVGKQHRAVFAYDQNTQSWQTEDNDKVVWYGAGENEFQASYPAKTRYSGNKLQWEDFNRFMIPAYYPESGDSIADWMRATAKAPKTINDPTGKANPLDLHFEHMLSKVTVRCDYSDSPTLDGETITDVDICKIFTRVQFCEAVTDAEGKVTINAYKPTDYNTDGLYIWTNADNYSTANTSMATTIVAPGTYTNIAKAWAEVNGIWEEVVISAPSGITLEAGKHYVLNVKTFNGHESFSVSSVDVVDWNEEVITPSAPAERTTPYVTFTADDEQEFMMAYYDLSFSARPRETVNRPNRINTTDPNVIEFDITSIEYSVGDGEWQRMPQGGLSSENAVKFGGNKGSLRLRGKSLCGTTSTDLSRYARISFSDANVPVSCTGDIRTLVDYDNYSNVDTQYARFLYLFSECKPLSTAPTLPATTLANYCYYYMFSQCTSLTTPPALPATTLADYCYMYMFYGCTSLTSAPELPATTLATMCYHAMFAECTALTTAPTLSAFSLADYCYAYMFYGCTSLTTAPELQAPTLSDGCYGCMFSGCTSLTKAPELRATTLTPECYASMFEDCSNLSSVTMLATDVASSDISFYDCLGYWLNNAGKNASSRTLTVKDDAIYNNISTTLPNEWKKGYNNTTVKDAAGNTLTE